MKYENNVSPSDHINKEISGHKNILELNRKKLLKKFSESAQQHIRKWEKADELEDRLPEIIQSEEKKEKRMKRKKQNLAKWEN